jgi:hypothetical protein
MDELLFLKKLGGGIVVHVLSILEAVPKIAKKRMVEVFQHPPLSDDVAHAL